jgi:hypothetical protein
MLSVVAAALGEGSESKASATKEIWPYGLFPLRQPLAKHRCRPQTLLRIPSSPAFRPHYAAMVTSLYSSDLELIPHSAVSCPSLLLKGCDLSPFPRRVDPRCTYARIQYASSIIPPSISQKKSLIRFPTTTLFLFPSTIYRSHTVLPL